MEAGFGIIFIYSIILIAIAALTIVCLAFHILMKLAVMLFGFTISRIRSSGMCKAIRGDKRAS